MLKVCDNPPMAYPECMSPAREAGPWHVAHTKARREKALARTLLSWEVRYFLPMVERLTIVRRRKVTVLWPLFGGYLFFVGDELVRDRVVRTNHVARILRVWDQVRLVDELCQIHRALVGRAKLDPYPFIRNGCRCRVRCGPLAGLEGVVVVRKNIARLVLQVEMLGRAAALEIDAALLERVA